MAVQTDATSNAMVSQTRLRTLLKIGLVLVLATPVFIANIMLLHYFNTLLWPYLWPNPMLYVLLGLLVASFWFRGLLRSAWAFRLAGLLLIFVGESYLLHTIEVTVQHFSAVAVIHAVGFTGVFITMGLNYFNQIMPRDNKEAPPLPDDLPYVALVIPTYGEPWEILENTVISLTQMDYPRDRMYIVISDDGHREEIENLARLYNINYNKGARREAKAGNLNSALRHIEENFPQGTLIVTQDADEVIDSSFLKKTVGYFTDPKIAFVQTPKEAIAPAGDPFGTRDRLFYDILQIGRNGYGAAFACGSGVIWRIEAVKSIGGFATWNVVEDLTTSYFLHSKGYTSDYHNEILSIGLAPDDIPNLLKQRGTWATDTLRLLFFDNPLVKPGLTIWQRLQYLELGLFYITSILFTPLLMFVPLLSLTSGDYIPIEGSALFPYMGAALFYYIAQSHGRGLIMLRYFQYWLGHWPTYTKGFFLAIRSRHKKPSYKVTRKTRQNGFYGRLIWVQFLYTIIGFGVSMYALFWMAEGEPATRIINALILLFFVFMMITGIIRASFYGFSNMFNISLPTFGLRRQRELQARAQRIANRESEQRI